MRKVSRIKACPPVNFEVGAMVKCTNPHASFKHMKDKQYEVVSPGALGTHIRIRFGERTLGFFKSRFEPVRKR
jgi:hypothetical protein